MLFKENRYEHGPYVGDTMYLSALPPFHSLILLIVAIPFETFPPNEFIEK